MSVAATKTCFIKIPFYHERNEKAGEFEAGRLYAILNWIKSFDKATIQPDVKRPTLRVRARALRPALISDLTTYPKYHSAIVPFPG